MQVQRLEHSKLAIIGNVDSGKSTLVGVLTKGILDDGRGGARERVFNYKHEKENGRTSSVAQEIMGFDENLKQVLPERFNQNKNKYWSLVVEKSRKIVTFLDLCGHEKYLKTTIFGLVAMIPDYSLIIVGANMGVSKMTREHLGVSLFLKIPFAIVLTKIDIAPQNVYNETIENIKGLIRSPAIKRTAVVFDEKSEMEEIDKWAALMHGNNVVPIFQVSSVSGNGLQQLTRFISRVPNRDEINKAYQTVNDPFQFDIQENFNVPGVGVVVSGIVRSGKAGLNQHALLGPDKGKTFKPVTIKSIHINRVSVESAQVGEFACFALKPSKAGDKLDRADFRKGMILIDPAVKPEPVIEFEANIHVLHHPTTMSHGYQAVMHCGVIRQAVEMKKIFQHEVLRTGDVDTVRLRFLYAAEYLKTDQILVIREGRTKIFGYISKLITEKQLEEEKKVQVIPQQQQQQQQQIQQG
ncbi:unnamed protein product (macronuclear) [Paramecium tetraurelia]|uniref:Tr-type G domain-containing protein n=1 Tax=Paramecium tetraurelia TaxID=5888 RepID=A0DB90_PARTE|nr:uncharacterized protein GSPATT00015201001 [Paramecium tetraurelia]CAK80307.1 unnamed protein product [Paramecium tetraurelia]|eukprot:XP_001447704.1 hypothetical protein (macronuclear) [Paramecium tetraurelia strain d4-2]